MIVSLLTILFTFLRKGFSKELIPDDLHSSTINFPTYTEGNNYNRRDLTLILIEHLFDDPLSASPFARQPTLLYLRIPDGFYRSEFLSNVQNHPHPQHPQAVAHLFPRRMLLVTRSILIRFAT